MSDLQVTKDGSTLIHINDARDQVVRTSLNLAATEWSNGRGTADSSMDLDFAQDQLDDALMLYVQTVMGVVHV